MSIYISSVKTYLKNVFKLYTKRRELKRVAFTGDYNDLLVKPVDPTFDEITTSLIDFKGTALVTRNDGGLINFHYNNASDTTASIREFNRHLELNATQVDLSGILNVSNLSKLNGVENTGNVTLKTGDLKLNDSSDNTKISLLSDGRITTAGAVHTEGALESASISTGGIISSGNLTVVDITSTGNLTTKNITCDNVTNSTAISTDTLSATSSITGNSLSATDLLSGSRASITNGITCGSVTASGLIKSATMEATSKIDTVNMGVSGSLSVSGGSSLSSVSCGNISSNGTITAKYFNSTGADLAEKYLADKEYPFGTLIEFGGEKEITSAKTKVNGVISEAPGQLLNEKSEGLPVALCGKVKILVKGVVNKFDPICLSLTTPGVGAVGVTNIIGRALESSEDPEIKLITCVTQFKI